MNTLSQRPGAPVQGSRGTARILVADAFEHAGLQAFDFGTHGLEHLFLLEALCFAFCY